jgi:hypothetical protein
MNSPFIQLFWQKMFRERLRKSGGNTKAASLLN